VTVIWAYRRSHATDHSSNGRRPSLLGLADASATAVQQSGSKRFVLDSTVQYRVCLKTLTASNYLVMGRFGQDRRQKLRIPLGLPSQTLIA
jgi:hypothetical protein